MDPIVSLLLKNGVFGLLAGVGFYLYFSERKDNRDNAKAYLQQQIADTAAKANLTSALEDLVVTVEALGKNSKDDITGCKTTVGSMIHVVREHLQVLQIERAKEEGRREMSVRCLVPTDERDETGPKNRG